ncbi:glycosyltransferase [Kitasatospora sp. NPDC089509]|uniref:glycosyltransferase n=1 Tax=Kitasatospora sp. NPDC089509 TaxID=3364079 RepID=UPI003825BC21
MRVALLTEGARSHPERGAGAWCDRLAEGLPEHGFELYLLTGPDGLGAVARLSPAWHGAHDLVLWGGRPRGRAPGALRRRQYARAYEDLLRALVLPGERAGFGAGLYRLAALAREDGTLPAFLASAHARRVLERTWRLPGADTPAGRPLVRDVLAAADLLEQCLRPLSAPWYGTGPGGLGGADLCHVVGGGPAALPALVARQLHGVPFVVTEHGPHLREQYLGRPPLAPGGGRAVHEAPYCWPVRALLLSFFRALTEETYRQAAVLTPGSAHDQQWQRRCGADPARTRVVYEGTPAVDRPAAGPEPGRPTLVWAGALEPGRDPELMLHAFARVRAELPRARLVVHGAEAAPGHRAHCAAVAERLGITGAVDFAGRPAPGALAELWQGGTVVVFSALSQRSPRLLADAMLSGRAVVSTDVGVAREVLGPTGLLVPARDPRALAGACLALLRDEERRSRLGLAGRLRAQERFAVEPVIGAFREIYLELVSQYPAYPGGGGADPGGPAPRPFARPAEYWLGERPRGAREDRDRPDRPGHPDGGPGHPDAAAAAAGPALAEAV